uniref:Uncharacterized protein n=1 Tax=Anguilla anguilla TaxID=7936 RepID=A0A0E9RB15_ANGAN
MAPLDQKTQLSPAGWQWTLTTGETGNRRRMKAWRSTSTIWTCCKICPKKGEAPVMDDLDDLDDN